jgi:hypothetical protein
VQVGGRVGAGWRRRWESSGNTKVPAHIVEALSSFKRQLRTSVVISAPVSGRQKTPRSPRGGLACTLGTPVRVRTEGAERSFLKSSRRSADYLAVKPRDSGLYRSLEETTRVAPPPSAEASLRKTEADAVRRAAQFAAGGIPLLAVAAVISELANWQAATPFWSFGAAGVLLPVLYVSTARRARAVRRMLSHGCVSVVAVGWTRSPDGCNFAIFPPDANPSATEPSAVIRLSTIRPTATTAALLAGELRRSKPVALFTTDGQALAVGRVRSRSRAQRVWARRNSTTPWYSASFGRESSPSV